MKIAYLCSDIDIPVYGHEGCSVHIREFVNALAACGHEVFIICASVGKHDPKALSARVYPLEPEGLHASAWRVLGNEPVVQDHHLQRDLRCVLANDWLLDRGSEILARERPDFLYERYSLFGWGGLELARRFKIPLVMELNAPLCREQDGYEQFTLTRTAAAMEAEILRAADAIIVVSEWLKNWTLSRGVTETKVHIVPNGVANHLLRDNLSGEQVRARYGLDGTRVIGFIGSFHWWHDVDGLLKAFSQLYSGDRNLRLLLVGDGENRKMLEKAVDELGLSLAVIFVGKVSHEEISEYLACMDVAVVPYKSLKDFYFSPLKLFECMAVGCPTVAAAIGQISEVIEHRQSGWLYSPGDNNSLAEGIKTLLENPILAAALGRAARDKVLREFTWTTITQKVVDLAKGLNLRGKVLDARGVSQSTC
jgi:glycosyltransferase involved in cell wall biosynthesis